ncbi:hypothetical protein AC578_2475 [Pseudocercospora eumusae]|uniref:SCP domain-containing protein n=1 Tax=Pseudocercospora eumusae TaxID=321146 RepID=A0A139HXK2_9PEZI|nr:hypothetical protein AC578_2475 [Pseudocercospora eumusae]
MLWALALTTFVAGSVAVAVGDHRHLHKRGLEKRFDYSNLVIVHHNIHRTNHSASPLTYDEGLASTAAKIAATCNFEHQMDVDGGGYGQNLAAGTTEDQIGDAITDMWYNGEVGYYANDYGQENPDMSNFGNWGHFSQMVWKATEKVGCATQNCPGGVQNAPGIDTLTVCNYSPAGNVAGEYGDNIGSPKGMPSKLGSYSG